MAERKVICVLGAYRSGTSLLTHLLQQIGVYLGESDKLVPPMQGMNDDGFYQYQDIENINSSIVSSWGVDGNTIKFLIME